MRLRGANLRRTLLAVSCLVSLAVLCPPRGACSAGRAQATLWVLQPGDELVEFDVTSFSRLRSVKLPATLSQNPEGLSVNATGKVLCALDNQVLLTWDGSTSRTITSPPRDTPANAQATTIADTSREWLLGADGESLFMTENAFAKQLDPHGGEKSVVDKVRVVRTDFSGRALGEVLRFEFPPCECETGACSETCPEAVAWAPGGVVGEFFFLSHFVQGQLSASFGPSFVYRKGPEGWRSTESRGSGEGLRDASDGGTSFIELASDGGCCGWENESSDQAIFRSADTSLVIFDEWPRYRNQDYDVSFFVASARIAPGAGRAAFSIRSTEPGTADLRNSADGHPDTLELASIRRAQAELPMVEVVDIRPRSATILRLPHADLIGWVGESVILVTEGTRVVAVDVSTQHEAPTGITVRTAADVFLVRP